MLSKIIEIFFSLNECNICNNNKNLLKIFFREEVEWLNGKSSEFDSRRFGFGI